MPDASREVFDTIVYRQCESHHTDLDATLEHNRRRGGRFSPPGEFGAIYVALDQPTVLRELERHAAFIGFTLNELLPRTLLQLRLHAQKMLDLTNPEVCRTWGLAGPDMTHTSHEVCWEIARAAYRAGYEVVQFRSSTGEGVCLAIFKDRLMPGSSLEVKSEEVISSEG